MPMKARYTVIQGEIVSENRNGTERDYVPDGLGSTVAMLDSTQQKTDSFVFWPFGETRARTGTTPTSFQFVGSLGYMRDVPARAYVRARHLDLPRGRWLTEDPLGFYAGDYNLYRYVTNAPTNWTDPEGLWCVKIFGQCYGRTCRGRKDCPPKNPRSKPPRKAPPPGCPKLPPWVAPAVQTASTYILPPIAGEVATLADPNFNCAILLGLCDKLQKEAAELGVFWQRGACEDVGDPYWRRVCERCEQIHAACVKHRPRN